MATKTPRRRKARNYHGLYPRNFAKDRRWAIDQDYLDKLSPDEREWLASFNDAYYGGDFRASDESEWGPKERSSVNRDKHASAADALTLANLAEGGTAEFEDEDHPGARQDWSRPPEYLESPEYKETREKFRSALRQGRRDREPVPSLPLEHARRKLSRIVPPPAPQTPRAPNGKDPDSTPED